MSERDRTNCVFPERASCGNCTLCQIRILTEQVEKLKETKTQADEYRQNWVKEEARRILAEQEMKAVLDAADATETALAEEVRVRMKLCEERTAAESALAEMRQRKDEAYNERNQCVALLVKMALALGFRAGIGEHEDKPGEDWDPEWRSIIYIDLPTGQVSWHLHDSQKYLLAGLPKYDGSWDGHDTAEKYRRVSAVHLGKEDLHE